MEYELLHAYVETPVLLSGPLRLSLSARPENNEAANLPAAQARVALVRARLLDEGRSYFHLENERTAGHPVASLYAGDTMYLIPRWAEPADLGVRREHFELLFRILTEAGACNDDLLNLIDWAIEPLHQAWWNEWMVLAQRHGVSWHGLTFELELAHRHYESIRAQRISMLNPWLSGAFPTKTPTLFGLLHAGLPPIAGYVALRLAGGSVGNLIAVSGSEEEEIAKLLVAHRLLRFAGLDQASGQAKYVRSPSFIADLGSHAERMKLPR
jgi:hypothetical protein